MMKRQELKKIWKKEGLSCRASYSPDSIKKLCKQFDVKFDEKWIYTENKPREISDGSPRIDGLVFLSAICKRHKIKQIEPWRDLANQMLGVGSYRRCMEDSYLGGR